MTVPESVGVVVVSQGQLRELLTETVNVALEAHEPKGAPKLLDRAGLAQALDVSLPVVDRLRREGCPRLRVGDVDRFDFDEVKRWLAGRGAPLRSIAGGRT